MDRTGAITKIN